MFAITQELFPIYKPAIGSWPFVLPTMTRQERRLVMENSFRPVFFFFFFLRFQQRYKHPHFSQENKTCETYIQRGFTAFQVEKDYKSCCFQSLSLFNLKAATRSSSTFHVTESMGESLKSNKIQIAPTRD